MVQFCLDSGVDHYKVDHVTNGRKNAENNEAKMMTFLSHLELVEQQPNRL